jgi:hypothetical protein
MTETEKKAAAEHHPAPSPWTIVIGIVSSILIPLFFYGAQAYRNLDARIALIQEDVTVLKERMAAYSAGSSVSAQLLDRLETTVQEHSRELSLAGRDIDGLNLRLTARERDAFTSHDAENLRTVLLGQMRETQADNAAVIGLMTAFIRSNCHAISILQEALELPNTNFCDRDLRP